MPYKLRVDVAGLDLVLSQGQGADPHVPGLRGCALLYGRAMVLQHSPQGCYGILCRCLILLLPATSADHLSRPELYRRPLLTWGSLHADAEQVLRDAPCLFIRCKPGLGDASMKCPSRIMYRLALMLLHSLPAFEGCMQIQPHAREGPTWHQER